MKHWAGAAASPPRGKHPPGQKNTPVTSPFHLVRTEAQGKRGLTQSFNTTLRAPQPRRAAPARRPRGPAAGSGLDAAEAFRLPCHVPAWSPRRKEPA